MIRASIRLFTFLASALFSISHPAATVVDLGYMSYEGRLNLTTGNTDFLGMRYAAAPTGNLRWRAPRSPPFVPGLQKADAHAPECLSSGRGLAPATPFRVQSPHKRAVPTASEDCLFLDVYMPPLKSHIKLPVIIWIHGGGYSQGSASEYNGNDLIAQSNRGVIVVVIQYRLGLFGFLPGNAIKAHGALNVGLLDQQFAFRWVQKHISKFGGDSAKVTIWGESSGAGSVLQHVIAEDGNTKPPLFRAAITSSTFLPSQYHYNDRIPEILYAQVVSQSNCSTSDDALVCLRSVESDTLQKANMNIGTSGFFGTYVFVPVVDETFIMQRPTKALQQRKLNGKHFLAVTNSFEGDHFIDLGTAPTLQVPDFISQLFPNFGLPEIAATVSQYRNLGSPFEQAALIMGEAIFYCPTYHLLQAYGGHAFKGAFAVPPGGHGLDLPIYFPSIDVGGFEVYNNTMFTKAFSQLFIDFAISLDPNVKLDPSNITPKWNRWASGVEMLFNRTEAGDPVINPIKTSSRLLERCSFWESVGILSGQ